MKKIIRLTESDLHRIIKRSVNRVLKESDTGDFEDYYSGEESQPQQPQEQDIINKLLGLGLRDVTNAYATALGADSDGWDEDGDYEYVNPEVIKQFLSTSGAQRLKRKGYVYQWFIDIGNRSLCSKHNFDNEDYAQENCDKYLNLISKAGLACDAYVEGIWLEDGRYIMDAVLRYEDYGDGDGFWMD